MLSTIGGTSQCEDHSIAAETSTYPTAPQIQNSQCRVHVGCQLRLDEATSEVPQSMPSLDFE